MLDFRRLFTPWPFVYFKGGPGNQTRTCNLHEGNGRNNREFVNEPDEVWEVALAQFFLFLGAPVWLTVFAGAVFWKFTLGIADEIKDLE